MDRSSVQIPPVAPAALAVLRWFADVLVPPQCPLCETRLIAGPGLCGPCHTRLRLIAEPIHPVTGAPLPFAVAGDSLDALVSLAPPVWRRARAAVSFEGAGRDLVHALKYRDRHDCLPLMARLTARAGAALFQDETVLVPVPLHWRRQWSRRYNQSALLAAAIARQAGVDLAIDAVARTRPTRPQVGLDEATRRRNVANAFSVRDRRRTAIAGRPVVLVDDVLTTGATAEAATRALMGAGAFSVDVLTFARVTGADGLPP